MVNAQIPGQLGHLNALRHEEREVRRAEAWGLRRDGLTIREIARQLDISTRTAGEYLADTLADIKETARESADSWRQLQLDRLDGVIATWLPVSRDPSHPEAARGAAVVVRSVEAQSRLLGLLQPNLLMTGTDQPVESIDEQLARSPALVAALERQLARAKGMHDLASKGPAQSAAAVALPS